MLYQRSWALYVAGSLPQAIQAASRAGARWKGNSHSPWYWKFRLLHAEALLSQGKSPEAIALLQEPVPPLPALRQLALRRQVDLANASTNSAERALSLLDQAAPEVQDPDLQARIHLVRGAVYLEKFRNIDRATAEFSAALTGAVGSGNNYREAQALNNLSMCSRQRIRYEDAVALATRSAEKASRARATLVEAQARTNLANYNLYLGNVGEATEHLRLATVVAEAVDDRKDLMVGSNLRGLIYEGEEEGPAATRSYQRAFRLASELDRRSEGALYASNVSLTLIKRGLWDEAAAWNDAAAELDRSGKSPYGLFIVRNQARIAAGQGNSEAAVEACRTLLAASQKDPLLRWEAFEIQAGLDARAGRYAQANQEYASALEAIDGARSQLGNMQNRITLLSRLIPFYKEYVNSLVVQDNNAKALTVTESSRARVLSETLRRTAEPMVFDEVALKRLAHSAGSVILSFWLAPQRSFVWLITPAEVQRFPLPPAGEIESLVTAHRDAVEHSWGDPAAAGDSPGAKLWNVLLAQIAPHIPKGSRVIVIPDGALHRINLETLPVPGPAAHYWIEDVELEVAPSMTLLASAPAPRRGRPDSLLVMGAPVPVPQFEKLPQADGEILDIQKRFADAGKNVYTGDRATPAAYRDAHPARYALIHFAAHAEPNPERPLESAIVLSPDQGQYRLKARDIIGEELHADLVTISACRSAGARVYPGEGLIGLAWAFLEAGSGAVIAGLWDVNDGSSRALMDQLYTGLAAGDSPAVSLHQAKLAMLRGDDRFRKPYFWGPFQAYVRTAR